MTPTAISKWVFRAKHSITNMLKALEDSGVIRRVPNRNDGRSVNIVVTSKGLKGRPKMLSAAEQISDEAYNVVGDHGTYTVASKIDGTINCNCPGFVKRRRCSHALAVSMLKNPVLFKSIQKEITKASDRT